MIAVDWGTSSLRCYRMDAGGNVLAQRRSELGMQASQGRFAQVLASQIEGWDDADILLCGMVGSRNGWQEVAYLPCPSNAADLAAAMQSIDAAQLPGRRLRLVPGMADTGNGSVPDVMRGEETQVCGLLDAMASGSHVICLPGTHSKWVTVQDGRITSIATAMTGETYALMRQHSLLGALMPSDDDRFDPFAFDSGLRRSGEPGGLLHHLFGVRTSGLFDLLPGHGLPAYLSGLLIGHEIRASELFNRQPRPAQVHLVGSERLLTPYARALTSLGIGVQRHSENVTAHGLYCLHRLATT